MIYLVFLPIRFSIQKKEMKTKQNAVCGTLSYFFQHTHVHRTEKRKRTHTRTNINKNIRKEKEKALEIIKIYGESEGDAVVARVSRASCHSSPIFSRAIHRRRSQVWWHARALPSIWQLCLLRAYVFLLQLMGQVVVLMQIYLGGVV